MKRVVAFMVAVMLLLSGCSFFGGIVDFFAIDTQDGTPSEEEEEEKAFKSPFLEPDVLCNYMHYFRGKSGDYGQWWFPGREPKTILGPEPWRRDVWMGRAGDYPYIGAYDNVVDQEIMRWHIRLAKAAGITAFLLAINNWEEELPQTERLLNVAAQENFKIAFMESHSLLGAVSRGIMDGRQPPIMPRKYVGYHEMMEKLGLPLPSGDTESRRIPSRSLRAVPEDSLQQAIQRIATMLNARKSHPAYYRIDGKPMIVIPYMDNELTPEDFKALIDGIRAAMSEDLYVVGIVPAIYWYFYPEAVMNSGITQAWADSGVNSFTHWTPNGMIETSQQTRLKVTEFNVRDSLKWKKDPMIPVMPGFDDDAWRPGDDPAPTSPRNNGQAWKTQLEAAVAAKPRFIFIQAWNEWHEGAQIEPSTSYSDPYFYLEILAQELGKTWQTPPLPPKTSVDPLRLPYLPY